MTRNTGPGAALRLLMALLALATTPVGAADDDETPWQEGTAALPVYPAEKNLLAFSDGSLTSNRFFIDGSTLKLDDDGVFRYTLVIRSASGAENVSFEGMRCANMQYKIYAYGSNGNWTSARDPQWRPVQDRTYNRYHATLAQEYLCRNGEPIRDTREALELLRGGGIQPAYRRY